MTGFLYVGGERCPGACQEPVDIHIGTQLQTQKLTSEWALIMHINYSLSLLLLEMELNTCMCSHNNLHARSHLNGWPCIWKSVRESKP
jgi:hypothetical protein